MPGSPFTVNVRRGCDPNKCHAFGPGLDRGFVNEVNTFTVETKGYFFPPSCSIVLLFSIVFFSSMCSHIVHMMYICPEHM